MANEITFKQYVDNPTGAKTAVISYRKMYEDLYSDKWSKIMTREAGKIDYELYYHNHDYYCYLKIPSENIEGFYYDVVIKMTIDSKQHMLKDCPVQFFSNDPSFNYTFAHAFKKNKLTIKDLESKMSKEALMKPAKERNPQDTIGYVKTLYFAYIVMNEKGLFVPSLYQMNGKKYNKNFLLSKISNTEDKINERTQAANKSKKDSTGDNLIDDMLDAEVDKLSGRKKISPVVKNSKFVGTIGRSSANINNRISGIKTTRTTKRIGRR